MERQADGTHISRRAMLTGAAALLSQPLLAKEKLKVSVFSKHLQWVTGEDLAQIAAGLGFDGIDLTVRKGGHIEPERVAEELPPLVALIRKHNLDVSMITSDIVDSASPHAETILKTIAELGIRYYRFGAFKWALNQPFEPQLEQLKPKLAKLAALNAEYQACAIYHTHSGVGAVGASIWDLYILMKDLDPQAIGINYDVAHATIEGGLGGWIDSFKISGQHLRGIAVKDFLWSKDSKGDWREQWKPIGEGMVRFPRFFKMVAESGFAGPMQLHFEYPLGGSEDGHAKLTIPREEVLQAMKQDLAKVRTYLAQASL